MPSGTSKLEEELDLKLRLIGTCLLIEEKRIILI